MKKRKILSLLLSLCLLIGLLPTVALAADQEASAAGVQITEKSYDSTTNILTVNVQIKMPDNSGIASVGTLLSYDSSKLTLLHKTKNDTTYAPSDPRISAKPSVLVTLENSDEDPYNTDGGVYLYGKGNRAGLFVGLGTTGQPSDIQKTKDWLTIYRLRFKVSGDPKVVLNSDSLRIADPAKDNDVIKGSYVANDEYTVSVNSHGSKWFKYGKMQGNNKPDLTGDHWAIPAANVTATYPGSTNSPSPTPATLTGIKVKTAPTKLIYNEGESFDKTGMVIEATYSDSSKKDVTGYTYTPTAALTTSDTTITISYTEGSETKTCTQTITVNAAPTEYTISFDVNGGSGTIPSQTTSGQKLSSLPTATHSGSYSFVGWYTTERGKSVLSVFFAAGILAGRDPLTGTDHCPEPALHRTARRSVCLRVPAGHDHAELSRTGRSGLPELHPWSDRPHRQNFSGILPQGSRYHNDVQRRSHVAGGQAGTAVTQQLSGAGLYPAARCLFRAPCLPERRTYKRSNDTGTVFPWC